MTASTDLDDTLANIRARTEVATEGPWFVEPCGDFGAKTALIPDVLRERYGVNSLSCGEDFATAEFIAHARTDVTRLLDLLDEQRAVIARVQQMHAPIPIYPGDCQSPDDEHGFEPAEEFCRDCPVEYEACGECRDEDGSWIEWPCETALAVDPNQWVDDVVRAALDGADTTTTDGSEA